MPPSMVAAPPMPPHPSVVVNAASSSSVAVTTAGKKTEDQTTTVYVGKIPPTVDDDFIRRLLELCGDVAFWRRVTDPTTGQLKGFAFCDFKSPEGVLRALRLLNGLEIDGHNLLLKVDEKNQKVLDAYTSRRNAEQHGVIPKPGEVISQTPEALKKEKEEDDKIRTQIKEFVDRQHAILASRRAGKDPEDLPEGDGDKSSLVTREIKYFRERQAQRDLEKKDKQREAAELHELDPREREFDRQRERDRLRMLRDREREKEARKKQREEKDYREKEREWESRERTKENDRENEKKRERKEKDMRIREITEQEYDSDGAQKWVRSRDSRRHRQREREEDDNDRVREREDVEQRRRQEEEKKKIEEQQRQQEEQEKRKMDEQQQQRIRVQQLQNALPTSPNSGESAEIKLGFASSTKRPKIAPVPGFAPEHEEDEVVIKKKRAFVPLEYPEHHEGKAARREEVQSVIDRIPTTKDELFAIDIDWTLIDKNKIVDKKMKPWVIKKIVEYLGEEEKTLIDFIMGKITTHTPPAEMLIQLSPVLDEEAEIFVVKMWRMLVYEMFTAAK